MAQDNFDIDGLAAYLHVSPQQVARLATKGRIPGRRVSGQWRFSRAEIHHWLEDRIGVSDEGELIEVEDVVSSAHPGEVRIANLLMETGVALPLMAKTRNRVIDAMADLAAQTGGLWDPAKMAEAVRAREDLHTTALDNGVAMLHPRRPMPNIVGEPLVVVGRTTSGIPFGGKQGGLTDVFLLICATNDSEHLCILARLSRLIADADFLTKLRTADLPTDVLEVFTTAENELDR
ncbi:MAG TPA: helix-turn-helix domain-containing protein [Planctomycetes bacterium]|nr:helix-turn-helix domain-containing protein [Planctomycetaceae bacterium]HIM30648.1 helix-turn-helix domain-containing protein [Planctomycetota bacterium]